MSSDQITINNLSKVFDNGFVALKNVNLNIKKGEILRCLDQMAQERQLL